MLTKCNDLTAPINLGQPLAAHIGAGTQRKSWMLRLGVGMFLLTATSVIGGCATIMDEGSDGNHTSPPYGLVIPSPAQSPNAFG